MPPNNIKNIIEQDKQRKIIIWVSIILGIIIIMSVVLFFIFRKDTISPSTNPQQYPPINSGDIIRDGDSNKIETVGEDFVDIHNTDGLALLDYGPVLDYIFINNNSGIYIKNDGQIRTFEMSTGTTLGINTYDFITNDLYKINSTNTEQAKFSSKGKYLLLIGANKEAMLYKNSINNQFSSVKIFNKKGILEYTFSEDEKYLYYSLINNITGTTIYRLDLINNKEELIVNIPITEYTLYTYTDQILAKTKPSDEVLQNVFLLKNRNDYTNIISDQNNDNNDAFVRKNRKVFYKGIDLKVNTSLEKCNSNRVNIFCFTNNNQKTIDDWYKKNYSKNGDVLHIYNDSGSDKITSNVVEDYLKLNVFSIKSTKDYISFINKDDKELWVGNINYLIN